MPCLGHCQELGGGERNEPNVEGSRTECQAYIELYTVGGAEPLKDKTHHDHSVLPEVDTVLP